MVCRFICCSQSVEIYCRVILQMLGPDMPEKTQTGARPATPYSLYGQSYSMPFCLALVNRVLVLSVVFPRVVRSRVLLQRLRHLSHNLYVLVATEHHGHGDIMVESSPSVGACSVRRTASSHSRSMENPGR